MAIERMLTEEMPARVLVARVLAEAGIEYVFGISGGHTGRIVSGLSQVQNQVRMVTVREESLAGVMAEVYGRLTRRPGVMLGQGPWVLGNGLIGTLEAYLSSSPMVLLTDFSDAPHFPLHAPYQQATGDYGSWDARRAFGGVTKQVMQAQEPIAAVQATQLAIKHAMAGQPGPVAVLFSHDALAGSVASFIVFYWVVRRVGAGVAAMTSYLVPVLTLAMAVVFLGDRPQALQLVGGVVILAGVRLATWRLAQESQPIPEGAA